MTALRQEELPVETLEVEGRPYFVAIEPLLSVAQVAEYAGGITPKTVYRAHEDGLLVAGRARTSRSEDGTGGRLVFRRSDVDAWLYAEPIEKPARPRRRLQPVEPIPVEPRSRRRRTG
jgi:hypothetical protein